MKKSTVIELHNIAKKYSVTYEKPTLIERIGKRKKTEMFWALKKVNLKIFSGEKVGIIGPNGAGKTTLLQIIAGITTPTHGEISVIGRVVSIIDIAAGFHPEITGLENIMLNGMLLGMTKAEIIARRKSIIAFAGIGKFIYLPVHTYSSGMKLRLGFAIAIYANPDILILDEGFSAGDEKFQKKVDEKIMALFKANKTIIITSHWREYLEKNCTRIITMKSGIISDSRRKSNEQL